MEVSGRYPVLSLKRSQPRFLQNDPLAVPELQLPPQDQERPTPWMARALYITGCYYWESWAGGHFIYSLFIKQLPFPEKHLFVYLLFCFSPSPRIQPDAAVWTELHTPVCLTFCQVALKLRRLIHICHLDCQDLQVSDRHVILHINLQVKYVWSCFKI